MLQGVVTSCGVARSVVGLWCYREWWGGCSVNGMVSFCSVAGSGEGL